MSITTGQFQVTGSGRFSDDVVIGDDLQVADQSILNGDITSSTRDHLRFLKTIRATDLHATGSGTFTGTLEVDGQLIPNSDIVLGGGSYVQSSGIQTTTIGNGSHEDDLVVAQGIRVLKCRTTNLTSNMGLTGIQTIGTFRELIIMNVNGAGHLDIGNIGVGGSTTANSFRGLGLGFVRLELGEAIAVYEDPSSAGNGSWYIRIT